MKLVAGFNSPYVLTEEFGGGYLVTIYGKVSQEKIEKIDELLSESKYRFKSIREFENEEDFEKEIASCISNPNIEVRDLRG